MGDRKYAEEGTYPITVFVSHDTAPTASVASSATVSDPAVSPTGGFTVTAVEGAASGSRTVATFTDPGTPAAVGHNADSAEFGGGETSPRHGTITRGGLEGGRVRNEGQARGAPDTSKK